MLTMTGMSVPVLFDPAYISCRDSYFGLVFLGGFFFLTPSPFSLELSSSPPLYVFQALSLFLCTLLPSISFLRGMTGRRWPYIPDLDYGGTHSVFFDSIICTFEKTWTDATV